MNENHYVSYKIARELQKALIEFPDSESIRARYKIQVKDCFEWSDWYLVKRDFRDALEGILFSEHVVGLNVISAPSLMEILERLPNHSRIEKRPKTGIDEKEIEYLCQVFHQKTIIPATISITASDAAALMLLKLKEEENGR